MQTPHARTHESLLADLSARQLRAFVTVADTLSYVEAADLLNYTEPGVFAQIKRLEGAISARLLVRQGRGLRLTPTGAALLPACRAVLSGIAHIDAVRTRLAHADRLTIVSGPVTGSYLLPSAIKAFTRQRPAPVVDLIIATGQELINLVGDGKADVGVSGTLDRFPMPAGVLLEHWFEEPHALYAGDGSRPAAAAPVDIYALSGASGPISLLRRQLTLAGIDRPQMHLRPSLEAVKGACAAGLGFALLPRRSVRTEQQSGVLREVAGYAEGISGHVWICRRGPEQTPQPVQEFLAFLLDFTAPGDAINSQRSG